MLTWGCGETQACEEDSTDRGLLGELDCVEFGGLVCEVDVWGGEGEEEMEDEGGFFKESDALSVKDDCDTGSCDSGVSVGFPSLVFLDVPKSKVPI